MNHPAASSLDLKVRGAQSCNTPSEAAQGRAVQSGAGNTLPQSPASLWLACAPLPIAPALVHGLGVHAEAHLQALQLLERQKCMLALGCFMPWGSTLTWGFLYEAR